MKQLALALAAILASAAPALGQAPPAPVCRMGLVAELPVTFEHNQPTIPVEIDGHPLKALLDTGAFKSVVFRQAADRLKLKLREIGEAAGVDGMVKAYAAQINRLTLMGSSTPPLEILVNAAPSRGIDMLIGRDILGRTDIELDLGHGKMRLLRPSHCGGDQMAYWANQYSEAQMLDSFGDEFRIGVRLNGVFLNAIIDSGAQRSIVADNLAFRGDVVLAAPVVTDIMTGVAGKPVATRRGVVKTLQVGDEKLSNVPLSFGPMYTQNYTHGRLEIIAPVEMLLGADFLKAHRVLVSHETGKVYFTYNGGPIFRAEPTPAKTTAPAAPPPKASDAAPAPTPGTPQ